MSTPRPTRSALYMPGSNARALEKAPSLPADALILDLEDAVAPAQKDAARAQVAAAVTASNFGPRQVVIRINGKATPWFKDDLAAAIAARPDAILLPKVETPLDLKLVGKQLAEARTPGTPRIWAMIETPLAVMNVRAIAEASVAIPECRLACLVLGTNDLVKDTGAVLDTARTAGLFWLSAAVTAARAYDLTVLDGVYNDFKNAAGFEAECRHGRMLGFDGKTLIHPDQIAAANAVFAPTAAEVAAARKIIAAFDLPENQGKGAITLDGRMVELLHAEAARDTVAIAEAIAGLAHVRTVRVGAP